MKEDAVADNERDEIIEKAASGKISADAARKQLGMTGMEMMRAIQSFRAERAAKIGARR